MALTYSYTFMILIYIASLETKLVTNNEIKSFKWL